MCITQAVRAFCVTPLATFLYFKRSLFEFFVMSFIIAQGAFVMVFICYWFEFWGFFGFYFLVIKLFVPKRKFEVFNSKVFISIYCSVCPTCIFNTSPWTEVTLSEDLFRHSVCSRRFRLEKTFVTAMTILSILNFFICDFHVCRHVYLDVVLLCK